MGWVRELGVEFDNIYGPLKKYRRFLTNNLPGNPVSFFCVLPRLKADTSFPSERNISIISSVAVPSLVIMSKASCLAGLYTDSRESNRQATGLESPMTWYCRYWCSW